MTILTVRHVTTYRYRRPVALGDHRMMFRPRDSYDQRLIESRLVITPEPVRVDWIHDSFGNCVAISRGYPDPNGEIDRWVHKFLLPGRPTPTGKLLMTLTYAIKEGFTYARRAERGTQEPVATVRMGRGSCRDFALLMMEAVRSLGLAARFVSGYLYVPSRDGPENIGGGSTHAWCQVYLPGAGWVEFDPIRVAVARDPSQAIPLSGTYAGSPKDELGMKVQVNVTCEAQGEIQP